MVEPHAGFTEPELPAGRLTAAADRTDERVSRPLRILIVEDQPFVALDCEATLTARGHEVVDIASSAQAAAKLAERHRPDLILMDIRLSGSRTGLEAAIEIHRNLGIRSLFASAHADDFTRQLAEPARPLGWLNKPYTCEELVSAVEACVVHLDD